MDWNGIFFVNSALLGVGLAMDAFSVSLANGMREGRMKPGRLCGIAGLFAGFQAAMPLIGWLLIHTAVQYFHSLEKLIPFIALALLGFIGGKMLVDGIRGGEEVAPVMGVGGLLIQGIATSIDALSVGCTIANYDWLHAVVAAGVIALVTFIICCLGLLIGKTVGTRLSGKAEIFGGVILIAIGIEIFLSSIL